MIAKVASNVDALLRRKIWALRMSLLVTPFVQRKSASDLKS